MGWGFLVAVSVLPFGIWSLLVERIHPGFLFDFFYTHHLVRFQEPIDHEEPFWFYLPQVAFLAFPGVWACSPCFDPTFELVKARNPSTHLWPGPPWLFFTGLPLFFPWRVQKAQLFGADFSFLATSAILGGLMLDRWTREAPTLASLFPLEIRGLESLARLTGFGQCCHGHRAIKGYGFTPRSRILGTLLPWVC